MKYLMAIFVAMMVLLVVSLVCISGCERKGYERSTINEKGDLELKDHLGPYWVREFEYDGCQYVAFGRGQTLAVTHKGNCKYCQEKNK